jgi:hypothetical protein
MTYIIYTIYLVLDPDFFVADLVLVLDLLVLDLEVLGLDVLGLAFFFPPPEASLSMLNVLT